MVERLVDALTRRAANGTAPSIGSTLQLRVTNLRVPSGIAGLLIGFDLGRTGLGTALPLDLAPWMPGCLLWTDDEIAVTTGHTGGLHTFAVPIPNLPAISGAIFGTQVVVLDAQTPNGLGALSNGGVGVIR